MLETLKLNKNRLYTQAVFLCALIIMSGCSKQPLPLEYFSNHNDTAHNFHICHFYGCSRQSSVSLTDADWETITAPLKQSPGSALQERQNIAQAIALMEAVVGEKTGTAKDQPGATMRGHGPYQLDCIDETVNTSLYLRFFDEKGLIKHHTITTPARRGAFIDGAWPHNTAVITDNETGAQYAIDSWYGKNGDPPDIVPLQKWLDGWKPS